MPRFSVRITDELLSQIQALEGNQRSNAQVIREILIEREIWKRLESDPFPAEYILPGGRSVKNKKAIEAEIVDKYLPSAFQLAGQIDKLEQDLRNLRAKQSNELLKAMRGVTFFYLSCF
jgi:Arc/MetJ family transcription regulator